MGRAGHQMNIAAKFDHIVITRFSAVFTAEQPPPSREWLEYRLAFFVEATCSSLERQRPSREYRWMVFFDDRCDADFKQRVESLSEGLFEPVWTHENFWSGVVQREVQEKTTAPYLITTRLDSDDGVAIDFIAGVQAEFQHQDLLFVNFPRGLQVDRSGAIYKLDYPSNPFLSLVEQRQTGRSPLTVFGSGAHRSAGLHGPVREVMTHPMWMQVVHGSNLANGVRGSRTTPKEANRWFDLELPYSRTVSPVRLFGEWTRQATINLLRRVRHPKEAKFWRSAAADRRRGTHTKPRMHYAPR